MPPARAPRGSGGGGAGKRYFLRRDMDRDQLRDLFPFPFSPGLFSGPFRDQINNDHGMHIRHSTCLIPLFLLASRLASGLAPKKPDRTTSLSRVRPLMLFSLVRLSIGGHHHHQSIASRRGPPARCRLPQQAPAVPCVELAPLRMLPWWSGVFALASNPPSC